MATSPHQLRFPDSKSKDLSLRQGSKEESSYALFTSSPSPIENIPSKADGIGGFLSALFTVTPLSVFAQNNGVIAITRCANRGAGRWCCFFLILFGILGKISGVFLAIPNSVLGGVTTFLFASVLVSGLRVLAYVNFGRRERFVLAGAVSLGVGNLLVPDVFTHLFDRVKSPGSGLRGLFDSITIILSTPCG